MWILPKMEAIFTNFVVKTEKTDTIYPDIYHRKHGKIPNHAGFHLDSLDLQPKDSNFSSDLSLFSIVQPIDVQCCVDVHGQDVRNYDSRDVSEFRVEDKVCASFMF